MDNSPYSYEIAAEITALRNRTIELENRYQDDRRSSDYLNHILKILKENPHLIVHWQYFLDIAEIKEPGWIRYD